MKILITHLSDIHLNSKNNSILNKKDKLCDAIKNLCLDADALFLVITGDIAFSGKSDEYMVAMELLDHIKNSIESYTGKQLHTIMVPGNHDCNHDNAKKSIRDALIKQIRNNDCSFDDEIINQCCEVQNEWFEFNECYQHKDKLLHNDKLLRIFNYDYTDLNIVFHCYNTAWISQKDEVQGILFPFKLYSPEIFSKKADFIITMFHHPIIWHNLSSYRDFMNHIEKSSDIVLTGHEHKSSRSNKEDFEGNTTEYIEGAILQDYKDKEISELNVIQIDLINQQYKVDHYKWNGNLYSIIKTIDWKTYQRYANLHRRNFELTSEFSESLNDAGALFKHPRKEKLFLDDFFVFPNLRDLNEEKNKIDNALQGVLSSKFLLKLDHAGTKVILLGAEKTGKTALCRTLFNRYYENKYIPIFIEGQDIKTFDEDEINKLITKNFSNQYSKKKIEEFSQLSNKEKVLIIDDFDKSRLNIKYKSHFLSYISKHFSNILITTNDFFPIEEIFYEENQNNTNIGEYRQFKILEFGYQLRSVLIHKWNLLGQEHYVDDDELIRKNDSAEKVMNSIIGHNYVPSVPIFLLTILQTIEVSQPHNLKESSYGYYYGYLITQALTNLKVSHEDLEAYNNYLTELAFALFAEKVREKSREDLYQFHIDYCSRYSIKLNFDEIISILIKASILFASNDIIRFRYKYVYYYFVARYLADNISEERIREIVGKLCKRLHVEEFANIVLFLTHHSRDQFIINELLLNAKGIFSEHDAINFDKDIYFVNELLTEIPKLVYKEKDVKKHRKEVNKKRDEKDLQRKNKERDNTDLYDYEEDIIKLDWMSMLNSAYKTIEIIGQILKNHYGSLKGGRKLELGEEAYFIGLRALKSFFARLYENMDLAVNDIKAIIEEQNIVEKEKVEEVSNRVLFYFCEMFSYSFISKVAQSLGSEKLSPTFKEILEKNNIPSVQLIDIAIKLDFYKTFPYNDLKALKNDLSNNYLPLMLLKYFVINYLYMFPTKYNERQRICSIMEIPVGATRLIDVTTTQRKKT
jgi:hypothetical protein